MGPLQLSNLFSLVGGMNVAQLRHFTSKMRGIHCWIEPFIRFGRDDAISRACLAEDGVTGGLVDGESMGRPKLKILDRVGFDINIYLSYVTGLTTLISHNSIP